jgi:DNA-directed RNA polymerase alpha subunit
VREALTPALHKRLMQAGFNTLPRLLHATDADLMRLPRVGERTIALIDRALEQVGLERIQSNAR